MAKQVIVIHGGDTFGSYQDYLEFLKGFQFDWSYFKKKRWKKSLQEKLGEGFEVILPRMPNELNAKYLEWKIWFEKLVPNFDEELVLVGHSLGGIFLAKYLSEESVPKKIKGVFLVAAPFEDVDTETLADFTLPKSLELLGEQAEKVFLYHSKDDQVVPFEEMGKYKKALPEAHTKDFEDRGHFSQEEFPELVEDIKSVFE